jgi:prefoldin subunit 5
MELDINEIIEAMAKRIGELSKENAILQATINKLTEPKKVTTAVTDAPKVQGTQGLK